MTDDELVELGLCDRDRLGTSRPAFIRMLLDQGASVEDIRTAAARSQAHLSALSVGLGIYPPGTIDVADAAERVKVPIADIREWWQTLGWPDPTLPGARLNDYDVRLLQIFAERFPMGLLPFDVIEDFLRSATASVDAIAESMLNTLRIGLDQPARARGESALDIALMHREVLDLLLPDFFEAIGILFRHAVVEGASADLTVNRGGEVWSERTMVFVDLVDYSMIAQGATAQLAEVLERFELAVARGAINYGGRLVKLLGDGAMLTFASRDAAIAAARALVQDTSLPASRAGIATGAVMMRHADYFGPVVNLASRLAGVVEAGEIAVDDSQPVDDGERMYPVHLKGIDDPVKPYRVVAG
jgi:adenylate cyclase